jgi:hypothetical protein
MFNYIRNSSLTLRINLNPFYPKNVFILPKFIYNKPDQYQDPFRHTFVLILPFIEIYLDLDRESYQEKYARDYAKLSEKYSNFDLKEFDDD